MKLHFVILLLVGVFVHATLGDCPFENETLSVGAHIRQCSTVTCRDDTSIIMIPCPLFQCAEGKQIGWKELDLSKPYPECCAGPICAK
ncbi:uncharacterized protein LOC112639471 [Camponotus floridanus]|uniref:uncharacterized protein LOC112639471 n=1 Tax=Camponotus floridanus TaxID=104421 RepID=UPI000DC68B8E|nr:uncharacterized protein LOC112639471 [Camponotus floridanus]